MKGFSTFDSPDFPSDEFAREVSKVSSLSFDNVHALLNHLEDTGVEPDYDNPEDFAKQYGATTRQTFAKSRGWKAPFNDDTTEYAIMNDPQFVCWDGNNKVVIYKKVEGFHPDITNPYYKETGQLKHLYSSCGMPKDEDPTAYCSENSPKTKKDEEVQFLSQAIAALLMQDDIGNEEKLQEFYRMAKILQTQYRRDDVLKQFGFIQQPCDVKKLMAEQIHDKYGNVLLTFKNSTFAVALINGKQVGARDLAGITTPVATVWRNPPIIIEEK